MGRGELSGRVAVGARPCECEIDEGVDLAIMRTLLSFPTLQGLRIAMVDCTSLCFRQKLRYFTRLDTISMLSYHLSLISRSLDQRRTCDCSADRDAAYRKAYKDPVTETLYSLGHSVDSLIRSRYRPTISSAHLFNRVFNYSFHLSLTMLLSTSSEDTQHAIL